jgi:carboxyl-terminal processing protease
MHSWQRLVLAILAVLAVATGTFTLGYAIGERNERRQILGTEVDTGRGLQTVRDAFREIRRSSVEPPSEEELARGAIKGMVEVLKRRADDPYALFYSPKGYRSFRELTTGQFSGIGVWLKQGGGSLEVDLVLPRTPARRAGLESGDVIRSIDGAPVDKMTTDEAVTRIKGPEGTEVDLGIERDGAMLDFTITRATIDLPNLRARLTTDDLGYMRLFGFARGAAGQVRSKVDSLIDKGAEGIVLDLRDNGGGLFSEAIDVASVFIENGKIVTYRERSSPEVTYEAEGDAYQEIPLVVLVNEGTASASEIVAGALQDQERAIIVGMTTYGKGSVQEVVPLPDQSALKLTTAAYMTPDGSDIDGEGIEPDVEVDAEPSEQRERAVEILKGIVVSTGGVQG